jgi:hypothetical protein
MNKSLCTALCDWNVASRRCVTRALVWLSHTPAITLTLTLHDDRKEDSKKDLKHDSPLPTKDNWAGDSEKLVCGLRVIVVCSTSRLESHSKNIRVPVSPSLSLFQGCPKTVSTR